jgi:hypothetical protein
VSVAPNFALPHLPLAVSDPIVGALRMLPPTVYAWWDPRLKERITPSHAYPRYPLRALGECYAAGKSVLTAQAPLRGRDRTRAIFVVNPADPAVNNAVTRRLAARWRETAMLRADFVKIDHLPAVHDIIEPSSAQPCTNIVYPKLVELIVSENAGAQGVTGGATSM